MNDDQPDGRSLLRRLLDEAKREYDELGGWKAFKSGEWLWLLIQRSFRNYWEKATAEYFQAKYGTTDPDALAPRLIAVAAKNAAVLGAITGAAVSTDEIVALVTAGEGGVGLPANIAIAAAALSAEAIVLVRLQLQLVANLGKLYGAPLDPEDPEDILTILAFALGGSAVDVAGKAGMKIGGKLGGRVAKGVFKKDVLALMKKIGAKLGIKILQRTIIKYAVPLASIGIGTGWNFVATKAVGRIAVRHFKQRVASTRARTTRQRPYASYWEWPEKSVKEAGVMRSFVEAWETTGFAPYVSIKAAALDPPNFVAETGTGAAVGIELTELVFPEAIRANVHASRSGDVGHYYQDWQPADVVRAVQDLLDDKGTKTYHGGPYQEIHVVIHTDETTIRAEEYRHHLRDTRFARPAAISRAFLLLSYDPTEQGCPLIELQFTVHDTPADA